MYIPTWLIIVFIIIGYYIYRSRNKKTHTFAPFKLVIFPQWSLLLQDFKVIDEETFYKIKEKCEADNKFETGKYHVLNNGIVFSVLTSDENGELVFNDNHKTFHTEIEFREPIEEIELFDKDKERMTNIFGGFNPNFYVRGGIDGFELGITTLESFRKVVMVGDNNDLINVATIPYSLIYKYRSIKMEELQKDLNKYGWEYTEPDTEGRLAGHPRELTHKYFFVYLFNI